MPQIGVGHIACYDAPPFTLGYQGAIEGELVIRHDEKSSKLASESVMTQSNPDFSDNMKQSDDNKSRYCTRCTRALKACLCDYIRQVPHLAPLHILQHPSEVGHPKGTAILLAASLAQASLHVGEQVADVPELAALLADPALQCYLLWPDEEAISLARVREREA